MTAELWGQKCYCWGPISIRVPQTVTYWVVPSMFFSPLWNKCTTDFQGFNTKFSKLWSCLPNPSVNWACSISWMWDSYCALLELALVWIAISQGCLPLQKAVCCQAQSGQILPDPKKRRSFEHSMCAVSQSHLGCHQKHMCLKDLAGTSLISSCLVHFPSPLLFCFQTLTVCTEDFPAWVSASGWGLVSSVSKRHSSTVSQNKVGKTSCFPTMWRGFSYRS